MNRAYLAGVLSGFAGGVMGAWLLPYLSDSKSHGMMAAAAAAQPQEVLSARRIQLVDNTGRTRAELEALRRDELVQSLGGLPPASQHAGYLAMDTLANLLRALPSAAKP